MKLILTFLILTVCINLALVESRGVNGGLNCAACTILTGVVQQKAYLKGVSIFNAAIKFCKHLPSKLQHTCFGLVNDLESFLIDKRFLDIFTPDLFCYAIHSCRIDKGEKFCHLFPEPHLSHKKEIKKLEKVMKEYNVYKIFSNLHLPITSKNEFQPQVNRMQKISEYMYLPHTKNTENDFYSDYPEVDFCKMPVLKVICDIITGEFGNLQPVADFDNDGFSTLRVARGSDWRGKDCSDINPSIYPGAESENSDSNIDHNCNGIWGDDPKSNRPWEDILCGESQSHGIAYIGDSIGAHFHMPESWINPLLENKNSIASIIEILLDEMDWPELGYFSGFINTTYPNSVKGPVDSLYLRLRNTNLCSHRDYQNVAKNAALAIGGINQAKAISRKPSDKPLLVIYAIMANDVCNRFNDTIGNMTSPEKFKEAIMETLKILNEKLPRESNVVLLSMLDASFIYPAMAERVHPLGSVFFNIHYKDLYAWFSCMQIGPCNGWMTPNSTLREITSKKAKELSSVLKNITLQSKFDSFQLHLVKNPLNTAVDNWVAQGGKIFELIDPVDSTHPTQVAQSFMAAALWDSLLKINVLSSPNPHNEQIEKLFGDQGGH